MAEEPSLREVLVEELRRQVKGWNSSPGAGPSGGAGLGSGEEGGLRSPEAHGYGGSALAPMAGVDLGAGAGAGARSRGGAGAAAGGEGEGHDDGGLRPPPASIVVDPIHLTLTLETLRNVMRASRRRKRGESESESESSGGGSGSGIGSSSVRTAGSGSGGRRTMPGVQAEEEEMPWPFRLLYGRDNYHVGDRPSGGYDQAVEVDAAAARGERGVSDPGLEISCPSPPRCASI